MHRIRASAFIAMLASALPMPVSSWAGESELADKCFEQLPFGSAITASRIIPADQTAAVGKRLGIPLKSLSNTYLTVHGKPIQVNILGTRTVAEANKLHGIISKMKGDPAFCLVNGRKVIEFVGSDPAIAIKTSYELGFIRKPRQVRYRITAKVATIDRSDYMSFNELYNLCLSINARNPNKESLNRVAELSKGFVFGKSLRLRLVQKGHGNAAYALAPTPARHEAKGDIVVYSFSQTPKLYGIPYVTLKADVSCDETGLTRAVGGVDKSLLSKTPFWPVDDPEVLALARRITAGKQTPKEKVQAILEWLTPGKTIKFGGPVTGSRWGVTKVLEQKFGQCWDFSDCFVTLARAAGVPCRQVGGWLYGSDGHIWAEVRVNEKEWQQVDPTGGGKLPCGIYHIPYFTSETGEMPILYLSRPQIDVTNSK